MAFAVACLLAIAPAGRSRAQGLDYHAYEQLFDEPVTASATGKPERVSETPVQMDVITAEDIRRSGVRDLPTLLRRLGAVDVLRGSSTMADVGIGGFIRSLSSRVMVTINDRPVYSDLMGAVLWPTLAVELPEIRQIEVIKGAQSALYGFNAVDGVINIVTFAPDTDPVNVVQARIGNHARRDGTAIATIGLGEGRGIRLTAATDHAGDSGLVVRTPLDAAFRKDPNRRSFAFDGRWSFTDGGAARIGASHTDVTDRTVAYNAYFEARVVTDVVEASYARDSAVGHWSADLSYTSMDLPWVASEPTGQQTNRDRLLDIRLSDLFKLGADDSFRLGSEIRHDALTSSNLQGGTLTGDLLAGSVMWQHRFSPDWSMVNAARFDHDALGRSGPGGRVDLFGNQAFDRAVMGTSVNSALVGRITGEDTLRLAFGRGLKLPSLTNFGLPVRFLPRYSNSLLSENPNLPAASVDDLRLAWDHALDGGATVARLALFHDATSKTVGPVAAVVAGRPVLMTASTAGVVTNGMELGLRHRARRGWTWQANYTLDRLHEHRDQGLRDSLPEHKINLEAGYAWEDWQAGLAAAYRSPTRGLVLQAGPRPIVTVGNIKAHSELSPHVAWQAGDNVRVDLTAENLWPYQDTLLQKMDTRYYLSITISY